MDSGEKIFLGIMAILALGLVAIPILAIVLTSGCCCS